MADFVFSLSSLFYFLFLFVFSFWTKGWGYSITSPYPNNIFAVYFSSNLLFLNIFASRFNSFCFLICTLLISFSQISFSNSSTNSITFPKFSNPSQVSSSAIYPFHLTKYFGFPLTSLLFNIFYFILLFSVYLY